MTLQITQTLTVPDSSAGRAAFVAAANSFGDNLTPWASQANAMAAEMNTNATAAATAKTGAETAQAQAEAARDSALAASTAIAADYNPGSHAYAKDALAWDAPGELYRCILAYTSSATRPIDDATHWVRVNLTPADVAAINIAVSALQTATDALLDVPQVSKSAAYTIALTDRGKSIDTTANVTVPTNATVAFPIGATVPVTNVGGSAISIVQSAGVTLRRVGDGATGSRTLASWGAITLRKVATDVWTVGGSGLT